MSDIIDRRKLMVGGVVGAAAAAVAALVPALPAIATPSSEGSRIFPVLVRNDYEPEYPLGSVAMIDPDLKPKDGDLVYAQFRFENENFSALLSYSPRAGKDENGRFVRPGDPEEIVAVIQPVALTRKNFDNGTVKILGTASFCVDRARFERVVRHSMNAI
jgi:hypothetical protein